MATISDADLPVGSHTISAEYVPDSPEFAASSSQVPASLVVQADATSTTITTQPADFAFSGQSVTFTATVENISASADPATPTGTVLFYVNGSLYVSPVTLVNGVATTTDASLSLGSHSITAAYTSDDPDFVEQQY